MVCIHHIDGGSSDMVPKHHLIQGVGFKCKFTSTTATYLLFQVHSLFILEVFNVLEVQELQVSQSFLNPCFLKSQ